MDMNAEENKALVQRYLDAMNMGNESYLDEYFAAEYTYHGPAGELNTQGFKEMHSMFLSAFPDAKINAEDMISVGIK